MTTRGGRFRTRTAGLCWTIVLVAGGCTPAPVLDEEQHRREVEQWRQERDERLRSKDGWLTLVGLHWLSPGKNSFGSDPRGDLVFPEGTAPPLAGHLYLEADTVRLEAAPEVRITIDGEPAVSRELAPDVSGSPDVLALGDLTFYVLKRGDRYGLRVKNSRSPLLAGFEGMDYFPINAAFRFEADFVPYEEPREVPIATVIDTRETMMALGIVRFEVDGREVTIEPYVTEPEDDSLWFIFRDGTSGKETYRAGRYLYTDREQHGKVIVDFNYAYNPPCVFTPYATCPLPPRRNSIEARIEAGEKTYDKAH